MMKEINSILRERRTKSDDVLEITRFILRREGKIRSELTENRDFWELLVLKLFSIDLWNFIQDNDEVPGKGKIKHMLWALMVIKIYGKERTVCSLVGGSFPKQFRKWV